jgi:hypothetical protein
MKRINLKEEIKGFDGKAVMLGDEALTVKTLLMQYIGTYASENAADMVVAYAIGQKVYDNESYVDLNGSEYRVVEKAIARPQHGTVVYVPLKNAIDSAESMRENKK